MAYKYKALDLPYSEQAEFNNYVSNYNLPMQEIDFEGLADYENSNDVLNAHVLNRINNDINIMQGHWNEDVLDNLHNKYNLFQSWIDNIASVAKIWTDSSSRLYYKNDIVVTSPDNGMYYMCLQDCNGSCPLPTEVQHRNDYWVSFYAKGEKGQPAYNLNYRGKFNWTQSPFWVDDIVYVINTFDVAFYVCISDVTYNSSVSPFEDEEHWILVFKVSIPALKILDDQPIVVKLYPSNLLYPSLVLFPTEARIITDEELVITRIYPEDDLYPEGDLYPSEVSFLSEEQNKIFGAKSTHLFDDVYLADFFDINANEQADIQSKTSLTQIGGISIAQWLQDFVDEYNL